ncbi:MAG: hypothetical protein JWO93_681 [Micrococcaceae bacterium]|nr:hypothetical protein [Micrococcaceae bacterium]
MHCRAHPALSHQPEQHTTLSDFSLGDPGPPHILNRD